MTLSDHIRLYESQEYSPQDLCLGQLWRTPLSWGEVVYMIEQRGCETVVGLLFRPCDAEPFILEQSETVLRRVSTTGETP